MKAVRETAVGLWDWLRGKKTYIGGAIIATAGALNGIEEAGLIDFKWFTVETYEAMKYIGGLIAVFGIRHALNKMSQK